MDTLPRIFLPFTFFIMTACAGVPEAPLNEQSNENSAAVSTHGSSNFERDRQAILAMAGEYRVSFDFEETVPLRPGYELAEAYHADATEFVKVIEDTGRHIVLQHILVIGDDHRVVKHWRQDWRYEEPELVEFTGHRTWAKTMLPSDTVKGTWTQAVYQVDDSPRYQSYGKWEHEDNLSSWTSQSTWRPLPRREYTTRDDYDVLVAVNRHTITPFGWVHEQDNFKLDLDNPGSDPVIAREIGLNRYEKINDYDFTAGYTYWDETQAFWESVRDGWMEIWAAESTVSLKAEVDGDPLWTHMFDMADSVSENELVTQASDDVKNILQQFMVADSDADTTY